MFRLSTRLTVPLMCCFLLAGHAAIAGKLPPPFKLGYGGNAEIFRVKQVNPFKIKTIFVKKKKPNPNPIFKLLSFMRTIPIVLTNTFTTAVEQDNYKVVKCIFELGGKDKMQSLINGMSLENRIELVNRVISSGNIKTLEYLVKEAGLEITQENVKYAAINNSKFLVDLARILSKEKFQDILDTLLYGAICDNDPGLVKVLLEHIDTISNSVAKRLNNEIWWNEKLSKELIKAMGDRIRSDFNKTLKKLGHQLVDGYIDQSSKEPPSKD